jgi:hypothetical protein
MGIRRGSISTPIMVDGLVFNMDAANRASYPKTGTTAFNTIDASNSGSLENGIEYFPDRYNGGFKWDAADSYIVLNSNFFSQNYISFTHCAFVEFYSVAGSSIILDSRDSSGDGVSFLMSSPGGDVLFAALDSGNVTGGTTILVDQVYHASITYDGQIAKLYLNGIEDGSSSTSQTFNTTVKPTIGTRSFNIGSATPASMYLYHICSYNRALSSSEVLHNYNALKGRFGL